VCACVTQCHIRRWCCEVGCWCCNTPTRRSAPCSLSFAPLFINLACTHLNQPRMRGARPADCLLQCMMLAALFDSCSQPLQETPRDREAPAQVPGILRCAGRPQVQCKDCSCCRCSQPICRSTCNRQHMPKHCTGTSLSQVQQCWTAAAAPAMQEGKEPLLDRALSDAAAGQCPLYLLYPGPSACVSRPAV
jgi:hypothetical protein